eukprot:8697484-Karenia_brevis.AAC.1
MYKGKKHKCLETLMSCGPVLTYSQAMQHNRAEALANTALARSGLRRSHAAKPAFRIPGPLFH